MYAITGITGKVGGELARTLITAGRPVRAVVRDARKGEERAAPGCEGVLAGRGEACYVARALIAAGRRVRAVVRDARKGEEWAALGCEVVLAEMEDASSLT